MLENKKAQVSLGLVTMIVFGIASLVIGVVIAFTITSTLTNANLLTSGRTTTTVTNETGWLNATDYDLSEVAANRLSYTLTTIWANDTGGTQDYDIVVPLANATVSSAGVVSIADADDYSDVYFSYTYVTYTSEEYSSSLLNGNFTSGVDNVSGKIPTVLLVAAVVLIIGVLAILIKVWQGMSFGDLTV